MPIIIKYKVLFSIDVLHHYFLDMGKTHFEAMNPADKVKQLGRYDIRQFLEFIPTRDCRQLMRNLQLIYKATATGVIIGVPTNEAGNRPEIDIPADAKFTFILKLSNGAFYNWTNLPMTFDRNKIYYFNNLDHNNATFLNLSKRPDSFQGGASYASGTFVLSANEQELFIINKNTANGSNADLEKDNVGDQYDNNGDYEKGDVVVRTIGDVDQLFESKVDDPNDTPTDAPGNDWKKLRNLPLNYTNANDQIGIQTKLFNFTLPNDTINATAELSVVHSEGTAITQIDQISAGNLTAQLDWRNQDPGEYQLTITNDDLPDNDPAKTIYESRFYLIDPMSFSDAFGVIDIYAHRSDSNNYALLAGDGSFQSTENQYFIRFKNRSTIWRYIFNASQSLQGNTELSVEDGDDKVLITNDPYPLTANGVIQLQLGDRPLPNASTKLIKPETENIYSEIFIHQ